MVAVRKLFKSHSSMCMQSLWDRPGINRKPLEVILGRTCVTKGNSGKHRTQWPGVAPISTISRKIADSSSSLSIRQGWQSICQSQRTSVRLREAGSVFADKGATNHWKVILYLLFYFHVLVSCVVCIHFYWHVHTRVDACGKADIIYSWITLQCVYWDQVSQRTWWFLSLTSQLAPGTHNSEKTRLAWKWKLSH